jgi:hypothetical protein
MPVKTDWAEPRLADTEQDARSQPDTETLLAELGAFYPVVTYPTAQENPAPEEQLDAVIFDGLVRP